MKKVSEYTPIVLGVDHGYGNTKTAHRVFLSGVDKITGAAVTDDHILSYRGVSYAIGESHLTYAEDKTTDEKFFILTLAAIAEELEHRHMNQANLILSAGLPLNWYGYQRKGFDAYLKQDREPEFDYKGKHYHVHIHRVFTYPQGLAEAHAADLTAGDNMIVDIGNGTMNIARIIDRAAVEKSLSTENYGVGICMNEIKNAAAKSLGRSVDERILERLLREGCEGRTDDIAKITALVAGNYAEEIVKRLLAHGFVEEYVNLHVFGGGGCLLKHYTDLPSKPTVSFHDDICANAKAFEFLAQKALDAEAKRKAA